MKTSRTRTLLIALAALVVLASLAGCGNKGDLVRPARNADAPAGS
jgi:predicted small lipoprotein YifL